MPIKLVKAYSRLGYLYSNTHLFPDYIIESVVKRPGLKKMFRDLGLKFSEAGEVHEVAVKPAAAKAMAGEEKLKFGREVAAFNSKLRDIISASIKTDADWPFMVGGDHSSAIGSIAGVLQKRPNTGLLWIDAHSDIHTPETTETGWVYGMPVAVVTGHGASELLKVMKNKFLNPKNVCLFGVRYAEAGEWANIKKWGVNIITIDDIMERGVANCLKEAMAMVTKNTDYLHVSLDIDVIDKQYAPGATEPTEGGLTYREISYIARKLGESNQVNSFDLVEGEPDKDIEYRTGKLCLEIVANILGKKYSDYEIYLAENSV
ncbi:MAG: arginase [bacterium]|nr:arginase [bacterium]